MTVELPNASQLGGSAATKQGSQSKNSIITGNERLSNGSETENITLPVQFVPSTPVATKGDSQMPGKKRSRMEETIFNGPQVSEPPQPTHQLIVEDVEEYDSDENRPKHAGRRKINIEYIQDRSRRSVTFSKRKAGIMKKVRKMMMRCGR